MRRSQEVLLSTSAPVNDPSMAGERHPKTKTTDFKFVFKEFSINLITACVTETTSVPLSTLAPLAKIGIDTLEVDGSMCVDGSLCVNASLNNAYLEDTRPKKEENLKRIVRLLEAKPGEATRMIKIEYSKDSQGSEEIRCQIYSCNIVACVSFLMQISDFFIPGDVLEDDPDIDFLSGDASELHKQNKVSNHQAYHPQQPPALNVTRKIMIRIDEPDIVLANDIENRNSEAILLNAQLNIDIIQNKERRSINMTVDNLRGHTCKFLLEHRENSMAQILKPTNMAMHYSQDLESRKTRIDMNFSSLVLNVSPASIQILLNSYNTFMQNMQAHDPEESKPKKEEVIEDNLWKTTDIKEEEHWYLKADEGIDSLQYDAQSVASTISEYGDEQMIFKVQQLIIILEYGRGNNTVPLVLLESKANGELRNWSHRLCVKMYVELEAAYYNSAVALWEPVIERLSTEQPNGLPFTYRWKLEIQYINNSRNDLNSAILSPNFDEADGFYLPEVLPPVTELKLYSTQPLQVTITRTFISVVNSLIESFSFTDSEKLTSKTVREDLIVKNLLGKSVTVGLFDSVQQMALVSQGTVVDSVVIPTGEERAIGLKIQKDWMDRSRNVISPLQQQSDETSSFIRIRVDGERNNISIPIGKTDMRFFPFQERGSEFGYELGFVSEVSVVNCSKIVTLKSVVVFKNYYPHPVKIWTEEEGKFREMTTLQSLEEWNAPTTDVYTHGGKFHFSLSGKGQNMGIDNITWKEIELEDSVKKNIECTNTEQKPSVFLNVEGLATDIFRENSRNLSGRFYTLSIRPVAVLKNCLPVPLYYSSRGKEHFNTLSPGEIGVLEDIRHGQSLIRLRLYGWRNADLECDKIFEEGMKELEYWTFTSSDIETNSGYRLDLGVQKETSKGTTVLSIFSPFWFVNKTKRTLYFKGHDGSYEVAHYPEEEKVPMMFSYITKSFFGKKKISLRVDASHWSDPFTIDTIGDTGKITCKMDSKRGSLRRNFISLDRNSIKEASYNIGIQISQSSASLTKIVTFCPYFMVYNSAEFNIEMKEVDEEGAWTLIPSKACVPVWPFFGANSFICRVENYLETTVPFSILDTNPSLLMLANKFGGIDVRTKIETSQVLVTLGGYKPGYAPVLLVNNTATYHIEYGEAGSDTHHTLFPGKKCLYTWQKPSGSRNFVWNIKGINKQVENQLKKDGCDSYSIGNWNFSWVSFLDGMQRVLLFTLNSIQAEKLAKSTGEEERIEQDIDISIHGIGVSLVNNDESVRKELAYLSVSSSDIVWEVRQEGKNRYRPLTINQCSAIEKDCENFKRLMAVNQNPSTRRELDADGTTIILDYAQDRMEKPYRGRLRRQFQKGLWLQVRTSPHQRQIHMKVNHIQLDNQLNECLYPVIAAPVPPPKSVTAQSVPHPFLEISVLEYTSPQHMDMKQYKYIHALIQEMQLKVELGFINAISCLFEEEEILDENTGEKLNKDLELARKPLQEHAILTVSQGKKDFYDYLHMSPLKIHVSFSLTSHNSRRDGGNTRGSNFILLLLQSFGVTITDSNDIIFRLAYFERKHQFYGLSDLLSEISRHYTSQAVKQMYVVLLGLDVIGNPYGLAVGVARSVEDLFYEPFQGAVEGPGEFAEGLSIGVRSVFSGVVGGAAGTVSKITGALGKGLATLTFDEKFQNKRREMIKRREQQNLVNNMASNVKDLSFGIVGGVAGVFLKPYEGATKEGVGGFFKGVGKGVAGLVTRPTGGIVDFASGTFDTVKRATEVGDQSTRVRPARYIHPDGVVRCYDRKEAEGQKILISVEKGRYSDDYYMLHENLVQEREVFMVTKKRLMKLKTVLGAWNVEWQYEYDKMLLPPTIMQEGDRWVLIIQPKDERKGGLGGFFSKNTEKKVVLPEKTIRGSAHLLARVIDALIKCNNNFESIFMDMIVSKKKLAMESW